LSERVEHQPRREQHRRLAGFNLLAAALAVKSAIQQEAAPEVLAVVAVGLHRSEELDLDSQATRLQQCHRKETTEEPDIEPQRRMAVAAAVALERLAEMQYLEQAEELEAQAHQAVSAVVQSITLVAVVAVTATHRLAHGSPVALVA
jgi:1-aminocyclopropane-1-carboxylate deaminase/D-cysteine desulfhydrase-like pyridoxal-dependent ACC family enzyme